MKISKELLQRYQLGQCSPEEEHAVRVWLESESWEGQEFESSLVEDQIGEELWQTIAPGDKRIGKSFDIPNKLNRGWRATRIWTTVAALLVLSLGLTWHFHAKNKDYSFELNNTQSGLKWMRKSCFDLALSENSSTNINMKSGLLMLSGEMMLKPKCDLVLSDRQNNISFDFKEGEVYFVSRDPDTNKLIVLRQAEIFFLPPIIQRQLKKQFHIT